MTQEQRDAILRQWVETLRSTHPSRKCHGSMRVCSKRDVFGVLCDIYPNVKWVIHEELWYAYHIDEPLVITRKLPPSSLLQELGIRPSEAIELADLNDVDYKGSFDNCADWICKRLIGQPKVQRRELSNANM